MATEQMESVTVQKGVWAVGTFNQDWYVVAVYQREIEALRRINEDGYGNVRFLPFGVDVSTTGR